MNTAPTMTILPESRATNCQAPRCQWRNAIFCALFDSLARSAVPVYLGAMQSVTTRFAPLLLLALGGCASADLADYPSLARRPIETRAAPPTSPPPDTAPPAPVSATLSEALSRLAADAARGDAAFQGALAANRVAMAAGVGAAEGGEAWAQAEVARTRTEAARAPTTFALSELDRLALEALGDDDSIAVAAITEVQARVAALVAAQDRALNP